MTLPLFGDDFRAGGRWLSGWLGMTLRLVGGRGAVPAPAIFPLCFPGRWCTPFPDPFILLFASLLFCFFHPVTVLVSLCYFLFFPFLFTICGSLCCRSTFALFLGKKAKTMEKAQIPCGCFRFSHYFPFIFPFFRFFPRKKAKTMENTQIPCSCFIFALFSLFFAFF